MALFSRWNNSVENRRKGGLEKWGRAMTSLSLSLRGIARSAATQQSAAIPIGLASIMLVPDASNHTVITGMGAIHSYRFKDRSNEAASSFAGT